MKTFHVGELCTGSSYILIVSGSEKSFNWIIDNLGLDNLNKLQPDTDAWGTVQADSEAEAISKVQKGDWQYSQRM